MPQLPALSEADTADAEGFLADLLLCLPVVGVSLFEKTKVSGTKGRELLLKGKGIEARGIDSPEGFVVRAGSAAVMTEVPSIHPYLIELRRTLVKSGVLANAGDVFRLAQDYTFNSPSTAAGVLLGRTANGRTEWKDAKGRSLKEIQNNEAGGRESTSTSMAPLPHRDEASRSWILSLSISKYTGLGLAPSRIMVSIPVYFSSAVK